MAVQIKDAIAISKFLDDKVEPTGNRSGTVRYVGDWTDEKVSVALGLSEDAVAEVRREAYGHLTRGGGAGPIAMIANQIADLRDETRAEWAAVKKLAETLQRQIEGMNKRLTDLEDIKTSPATNHLNNGAEAKQMI